MSEEQDQAKPDGVLTSGPGRPRIYATDADRVRAFRQRKKDRHQDGELESIAAATPNEAVGTLERTLTELRGTTTSALEQFTVFARQITAAVDKVTDPAALDAERHRVAVDSAQTKARYDADIAELRTRLDTALEDRQNADAAVAAVDAQLAATVQQHQQDLEQLTRDHHTEIERREQAHSIDLQNAAEQLAALESDRDTRISEAAAEAEALRLQLHEASRHLAAAEQRAESAERTVEKLAEAADQRIADLRSAADRAASAAASTIARLEESLQLERASTTAARDKVDALRDDLEQARIDSGAARAAEAIQRGLVEELRAEILVLRTVEDQADPEEPGGDEPVT